jgi:hypothetical protein
MISFSSHVIQADPALLIGWFFSAGHQEIYKSFTKSQFDRINYTGNQSGVVVGILYIGDRRRPSV